MRQVGMDQNSNETDLGEMASEMGGLMTGLGVISMTWFPFALPALVMAAILALPLVVLGLPALAIWLMVRGARRLTAGTRRSRPADSPRPSLGPASPARS
jgi:hypothetical protein